MKILVKPNEAFPQIQQDNRITIVFQEGFDEFSPTSNEFREEIYAPITWDEKALWGGEFKYETFFQQASQFERGAIERILKAGEWDYIILHDRKDEAPNHLVLLWNANKTEK